MALRIYLIPIDISLIYLISICAAIASVSVVFLSSHAIGLKAGTVLMAICLGMLFSQVWFIRFSVQQPWSGIPTSGQATISGVARSDSAGIPGDKSKVLLAIDEFTSTDGRTGTAGGDAIIIISGETRVFWGERICISQAGVFWPNEFSLIIYCSADDVARIEAPNVLLSWRERVIREITAFARSMPLEPADFFLSIFLGIRENPEMPRYHAFRDAGCIHVLALSGMHLGIIAALIGFMFKRFLPNTALVLLVVVIVSLYVIAVGPRPSLSRALLMYVFYASGKITGRESRPSNTISKTFIVQCILFPQDPMSLSFSLSFLAIIGMVTAGRRIERLMRPYLPALLSMPLSMAVGAQIGTAPVSAGAFGALRPIGIISTLLVAPLTAFFLYCGIGFLLAAALRLRWVSYLLLMVLNNALRAIMDVVNLFAQMPALLKVPPPWLIGSIYGLIIIIIWIRRIVTRYIGGNGST